MSTLNLDRFSDSSRRILDRAQKLAKKRRHRHIEPVHVMISLLMDKDPATSKVLQDTGANLDAMLAQLNSELGLLPRAYRALDQIFISDRLVEALNNARGAAQNDGHNDVPPGYVIVALAGMPSGMTGRLLRQQGATPEALQSRLRGGGGGGGSSRSSSTTARDSGRGRTGRNTPAKPLKIEELAKYGDDMTAMAEEGKFDPVVGREDEVRRLMQVLCRRSKNNPILIGAPGVGKNTIVEALCQRVVSGDVPEGLKGRRIFMLDLPSMKSGTSLRGQFEERVQNIMNEIRDSEGRVIVYINEIHTIADSGEGSSGGGVSGLLKPALARGHLRCIGTTTQEEYKQYIEKDRTLVRQFQEIEVAEPETDEAIAILRGVKQKYEIHHHVRITDAALVAAVKFSERYIPDQRLPDKAIGLIDQASAQLRLEIDSKPTEVDRLERRVSSMQIELAAIIEEQTEEAIDTRARLEADIEKFSEEVSTLDAHWRREKEILDRITHLQEELDATDKNREKAIRDGDVARASELERYVRPSIVRDIDAQTAALSDAQKDMRLLKQDVDADDIADVISDTTVIPVNKMLESDRERLLKMEERLTDRVVGQNDAIAAIATAVRRSRAGVSDPNRPIGNFFFVGPTGVGKTELAKALAVFLFDTEDSLIRIDMSEYQDAAKVNTLIGSAIGYVGSDKGGVLTEAVRRKPYSVVLFDETEKAHIKVFDILLQVMDEGRLTDSQGLEVDFTNTIIIMTSNVGSRQILDMTGKLSNEEMTDQVNLILRNETSFRPEFLARIDDIVVFNALNMEAMDLILEIQLKKLNKILAEQKLAIELSDKAKHWVAEEGFEPEYGARPLKRAVLNHIQDPLATLILENKFQNHDMIYVDVNEEDDALTFTRKGAIAPDGKAPEAETDV